MPELPEVYTFQQYFESAALHQTLRCVDVTDDHIIRELDGAAFAERLAGRTFTDTLRRGKYLFCRLDHGHDVLLHFGMTGDLHLYQEPEDRPAFERFAFVFENGSRLAFVDPRKFARVMYLQDRDQYIKDQQLGEDALQLEESTFLRLLGQRKLTLKSFLLNQKFIAGIGNLYADEICYRARVHPNSMVSLIPLDRRKELYRQMKDIMNKAVEKLPYYKEYPENWFWNEWRYEGATGVDGYSLVRKTIIAGRTTYYCEGWQREYRTLPAPEKA